MTCCAMQVGSEVARRGIGLGFANVIAFDPYASEVKAAALGVKLVSWEDALAQADFFSLHMPQTPQTKVSGASRSIEMYDREPMSRPLWLISPWCETRWSAKYLVLREHACIVCTSSAFHGWDSANWRNAFPELWNDSARAWAQGMFNDEAFSKMKKGARIVNVARGGVIDEAALARALDNGQVAQVPMLSTLRECFCCHSFSALTRSARHSG